MHSISMSNLIKEAALLQLYRASPWPDRHDVVKRLQRERLLAALVSLVYKNHKHVKSFLVLDPFKPGELNFGTNKKFYTFFNARIVAINYLRQVKSQVTLVYAPMLFAFKDKDMTRAFYGCGNLAYWHNQVCPPDLEVNTGYLTRNMAQIERNYLLHVQVTRLQQEAMQQEKQRLQHLKQTRGENLQSFYSALYENRQEFLIRIKNNAGDVSFYDKRSYDRQDDALSFHTRPGAVRSLMKATEAMLAAKKILDIGRRNHTREIEVGIEFPCLPKVNGELRIVHVKTGFAFKLPDFMQHFKWKKASIFCFNNAVVSDQAASEIIKKMLKYRHE